MKSIPNALVLLILSTSLSACSWSGLQRVSVDTVPTERVPLALPDPSPLQLKPVRWKIITPDNVEQVWKELAASGSEVVLFAVTADGYEQLSLDFADIRNHIATQRNIIIKYREYYEIKKP